MKFKFGTVIPSLCKISCVSDHFHFYPSFSLAPISCYLPHHALQALNFGVFFPSQSIYWVIHCKTGDSTARQETLKLQHVWLIKWIWGQRVFLYWMMSLSFQMPHCRTDNIITETSRLVGTEVQLLLTLPREQSVSDTKTYIQEVISRHLLTAWQCKHNHF